MQDRKMRKHTIRMIVGSQRIDSQEQLLAELDKAGFACTQTTLSRDLRQLRISKLRMPNGRSVYALPSEMPNTDVLSHEDLEKTKWSVQFSGNIMVVHTPPGHAGMVAYDIDKIRHPFFIGTVAGDDTVIVVMAENVAKDDAKRAIQSILPQLAK